MAVLWKAWKAKSRLPPLPTSPLEIPPMTGGIPTFPPRRRRRRTEKWKTKTRFPTFPPPRFPLSQQAKTPAGAASPLRRGFAAPPRHTSASPWAPPIKPRKETRRSNSTNSHWLPNSGSSPIGIDQNCPIQDEPEVSLIPIGMSLKADLDANAR